MMTEYTPTTEDVRKVYYDAVPGFYARSAYYDATTARSKAVAQFDRWLAEHDRKIAEAVWDNCIASLKYSDGSSVEIVANGNPYRGEA